MTEQWKYLWDEYRRLSCEWSSVLTKALIAIDKKEHLKAKDLITKAKLLHEQINEISSQMKQGG